MRFTVLNSIPEDFFTLHPSELVKIFDGPTLIHLDYGREETILISFMLHGNEHSGFYAVREYFDSLKRSEDRPSRNVSILVGNVRAAAQNERFLEGQKDLNRIWSDGDSLEEKWAQNIYQEMSQKKLFATLDLHNNTGKNPHYCAVTNLKTNTLRLASLFDGDVLYFTDPKEVFSNYFSRLCPCLTIEAGQSGDKEGILKIISTIEKLNEIDDFDQLGEIPGLFKQKKLFESFGKIKIPDDASISFSDSKADFIFGPEIENWNFSSILPGSIFGIVNNIKQHLLVFDSNNRSISGSYFKYIGNKIVSIEEFYPAMITTNSKIVQQDCLCYLLRVLKI